MCNLSSQIENHKWEKKVASDDFEKTIDKLTQTLELSKVKTEEEENLLVILAETQALNLHLKKENRRLEDVIKNLNKKIEAEKAFKREIKDW